MFIQWFHMPYMNVLGIPNNCAYMCTFAFQVGGYEHYFDEYNEV